MEIREVQTGQDLKTFLNLPREIYAGLDRYVQPLNLHMKMMMGKLGTPEKHFFIAYDEGKPVARIGFKVHKHNDKTMLHFGFFECKEGKAEAVPLLLKAGQEKYPSLNLMGPFHFRMEDPYVGVLADGYDRDPYFLMPYNPPFYCSYLEQAGLETIMDLFTYELSEAVAQNLPPVIKENAEKAYEKGIRVRYLDPKNLDKEARTIATIFNDALSKNWGFEEFLDEQINEMVTLFKLFIDPRVVSFAQHEGKDVGCLIMLPNFNPLIKKSQGRLTPGLIWRFLTQKKKLPQARGYALGVLREYHSMGIGSALTHSMFEKGVEAGYKSAEISWILANNGPMNELSKAMGGRHNKVYRIYGHNHS